MQLFWAYMYIASCCSAIHMEAEAILALRRGIRNLGMDLVMLGQSGLFCFSSGDGMYTLLFRGGTKWIA